MSGVLWCLNVNRSKTAIADQLAGMAAGSPGWLAGWQSSAASAVDGHGEILALGLAGISVLVGIGVFWRALRLAAVAVGIGLSVVYWVLGQSLGGPFWAGQATDVNAGPVFVLLGLVLVPGGLRRPATGRTPRAGAPKRVDGAPPPPPSAASPAPVESPVRAATANANPRERPAAGPGPSI